MRRPSTIEDLQRQNALLLKRIDNLASEHEDGKGHAMAGKNASAVQPPQKDSITVALDTSIPGGVQNSAEGSSSSDDGDSSSDAADEDGSSSSSAAAPTAAAKAGLRID